ncbi:MAG: phospholipase A [Verrucomicrobia bacterium]|nr:phospholipase A [Verrucomicrobiota bacterium]
MAFARALRLVCVVLLGLLAGGLVRLSAAERGMVMQLSGPGSAVETGSRVSLWLTFLNDAADDLTRTFPETLKGKLTEGSLVEEIEFTRVASSEPAEVRVQAGRFVRREYALTLPALASGRATIEFIEPAGLNPLLIEVKPRTVAVEESPQGSALVRFLKEAVLQDEAFDSGAFFKKHISGYEPFYFIAGPESPNAKFQVSIKYQLVNADSRLAARAPALKGFHFAYSQTSLWDWNGESAPFFDSSYRPEMLYKWERAAGGGASDWFRLDLQGGVQHESNGKGGADSRSLNIAYLRPSLTLGKPDSLQLSLSPRAWVYVLDLDDNRDLEDYRGYVDLRAVVGWAKGVQLSAIGRMGDDRNRGSVQLDLTYPMMKLLSGSFSFYLHAQYFNGYGESLLLYNERGDSWRLGFSLYR